MSFGGGLILHYANDPVLFERADGGDSLALVDDQLVAHAMVGFGLWDRAQIELGMPLYLIHRGDTSQVLPGGGPFEGFAAGDMDVRLKAHIWSNDLIGLAASLSGSIPLSSDAVFVGDPGFTVTPSLITQVNAGPVMIAGNLGARLRATSGLRDLELGSALEYRLGAQWAVLPDLLALDAEVYGRAQIAQNDGDELGARATPLEALVGPKLTLPSGLHVMLGVGTGLLAGYGSAQPRILAGVTYTKPLADPILDQDGDGFVDDEDACPTQPEDRDGWDDEDGCPDLDNDSDGILDMDDGCPDDAEDLDGWKDEDGCPEDDDDSDGDGVVDTEDTCPEQPEDLDGWKDEDGCPDPDNDDDAILDVDDDCPDTKGVPEARGCPQRVIVTTKTIDLTEKIFFDFDKSEVRPEDRSILDEAAEVLKKYPQLKLIEISGHTDKAGERKYNVELSRDRANAVRAYLIKRGVSPKRLRAVGYGYSRPLVAVEKSEADSAKNRRVSFDIIEQEPITIEETVPVKPGD